MKDYFLIENDFLNKGKCVYKDSYGNKLQMFRKSTQDTWKQEFSAKLRFNNPNVSADALIVTLPISPEQNGSNIHLKFADGKNHANDKDIISALNMMSNVIQTWIHMLDAISSINIHTTENNAKAQIEKLGEFIELKDLINGLSMMYPC